MPPAVESNDAHAAVPNEGSAEGSSVLPAALVGAAILGMPIGMGALVVGACHVAMAGATVVVRPPLAPNVAPFEPSTALF